MYRERMAAETGEKQDIDAETPTSADPGRKNGATKEEWNDERPRPRSDGRRSPKKLTHTDDSGRAKMVDIGGKPVTAREARARGRIWLGPDAFALVRENKIRKGDVVTVAQLAGIMAAKRTADLIPLCHNIALSSVDVTCSLNEAEWSVDVEARVQAIGGTGVEMEAVTAVSVAALTVYDMCKAVTRDMVISDIRLMMKTGGVRGDYWAQR